MTNNLLKLFKALHEKMQKPHCLKSVRTWDYFGSYSVWEWENTDQHNSEYGHFLRMRVNNIIVYQ